MAKRVYTPQSYMAHVHKWQVSEAIAEAQRKGCVLIYTFEPPDDNRVWLTFREAGDD